MILEHANLEREAAILKDTNYELTFLTRKATLSSDVKQAALNSIQVWLVFVFAMLAFSAPPGVSHIAGFIATVIIAYYSATVVVLLLSTLGGRYLNKLGTRKALLFWAWWPLWMCALCYLAALAGGLYGHNLWTTGYSPYYQLARMQTYTEVDPSLVSGEQVQDAGLIRFGEGVGIDRARGGCFVNGGHTYCVAPILVGGRVRSGLGDSPQGGSYDFFSVGMDCCNCPNQDFRCGEWDNPLAQGGMRSVDYESRPFYRLAVDDWAAKYGKNSRHPLFFDWVQMPVRKWKHLFWYAANCEVFAAFAPVPLLFLLLVLLAKLLSTLVWVGIASPRETPLPPRGLEKAWERLLPNMLQAGLDEQRQWLAPPEPLWYGAGQEVDHPPGNTAPQQAFQGQTDRWTPTPGSPHFGGMWAPWSAGGVPVQRGPGLVT